MFTPSEMLVVDEAFDNVNTMLANAGCTEIQVPNTPELRRFIEGVFAQHEDPDIEIPEERTIHLNTEEVLKYVLAQIKKVPARK